MAGGAPTIRVDFQNSNATGTIRLNTRGTMEDLAAQGVRLVEGMSLRLVDAELKANGYAHFDPDERIWVAVVDWEEVIPLPEVPG